MSITLLNKTSFPAQYTVMKGKQIIVNLPALEKNESVTIPTIDNFVVIARTVIDGNTYASAPMPVQGAQSFMAQIIQTVQYGTYVFEVIVSPSKVSTEMQFQKTCKNPVTFSIYRDMASALADNPLQSVVVSDSFNMATLDISDTYTVYAVIDGVTTAPAQTSDGNATFTAVVNTTEHEAGYFNVRIS